MILHIDMDAFYASVEEREQPQLRGKPLIVGGRPEGRGVVAAASYAAREFGVRSAMPTARAVRLCPDLVIIPPRGGLYQSVSTEIRGIFQRYTPIIEPLSLDEAFLDARGSEKLYGSSEQIGRMIKQDIYNELGLVASVGVAPNKFLAKLASDQDKPDGFTVIQPEQIQDFLDPLPVERIWGVGKAAQYRLNQSGIYTVKELRNTSESYLEEEFGKTGTRLWALSHGLDNRPVVTDSEAKSISHETTFDNDITSFETLESVALSLTEGVCFRLRQANLSAKTVNLKVRYHDFSTVTRSHSMENFSESTLEIWNQLDQLLKQLLQGRRFSVRLIGVGVSNFGQESSDPQQADLFLQQSNGFTTGRTETKQQKLDQLSDQITQKYGKKTIRRGRSI